MKHLSTLCLTLFITLSVAAQSHKEVIIKEAQTYYDYMTNQNFDGVLDYMYPKVFEMASRDQMKAGMEQMFSSPDMKIEFLNNDITSVSDKKEVEGVTYAAVYYNSKMKMTFLSELDKPEADKKTFIDFMKATMDTQFGVENVTADEKTMSLVINMDATMFAIKDPKYNGWKFIGNDDAMQMLVNSIIPESVRAELLKKE
ncbi:hypothetical protein SAMN04515667_0626 [Formosa sp. Hel1_31_208]|uniref:hypothetical protein n=1 Tax=Formosa sp. Hel1_31_208 TaxID=1798225 RepID=UPI00087C9B87|nr:hypothetical protein [Formosa sp. Hel1_31_208]SDR77558.1 hypothetical protein SAMN04515667_0626 [Formosa sp. Hel1_31_208]